MKPEVEDKHIIKAHEHRIERQTEALQEQALLLKAHKNISEKLMKAQVAVNLAITQVEPTVCKVIEHAIMSCQTWNKEGLPDDNGTLVDREEVLRLLQQMEITGPLRKLMEEALK